MTTCLRGDGRYHLSTWSAIAKVQAAGDAWNTRRVSLSYTENLCGRTRTSHWQQHDIPAVMPAVDLI